MNFYRLLPILKKHKIIFSLIAVLLGGLLAFLFLFKANQQPIYSKDNGLNILLLGAAGGEHAGADLTDTIFFVNINPEKNQVVLVSIPRDLYSADLNGKINAAYVLGQGKREGGGLILAKSVVSKIIGEQIDYVVKIDFAGFIKAINLVGGVDLEIDNTFDDFGYPVAGRENDLCGLKEEEIEKLSTPSAKPWEVFPCRFEHLHFEKGKPRMNGETALKFVRSRNAEGDEGTDFARSRRQQKVIFTLKEKLFAVETLFNPLKLATLYKIILTSLETDVPISHWDDFVGLAQKMKNTKVRNAILDYGNRQKGTPGLLINPPVYEYEAWVLIPRRGEDDFSEIQEYVKCQIESDNCPIE